MYVEGWALFVMGDQQRTWGPLSKAGAHGAVLGTLMGCTACWRRAGLILHPCEKDVPVQAESVTHSPLLSKTLSSLTTVLGSWPSISLPRCNSSNLYLLSSVPCSLLLPITCLGHKL